MLPRAVYITLVAMISWLANAQIVPSDCPKKKRMEVYSALQQYLADNSVSNVNVPPIVDNKMIDLRTLFTIVAIQNVEEQRNSITVSGALVLLWDQSPLGYKWSPKQFCNVTTFTLNRGQGSTWTPKLTLTNMQNLADWRDLMEKTPIELDFDGHAQMTLYSTFELSCSLRLRGFPFDSQVK